MCVDTCRTPADQVGGLWHYRRAHRNFCDASHFHFLFPNIESAQYPVFRDFRPDQLPSRVALASCHGRHGHLALSFIRYRCANQSHAGLWHADGFARPDLLWPGDRARVAGPPVQRAGSTNSSRHCCFDARHCCSLSALAPSSSTDH